MKPTFAPTRPLHRAIGRRLLRVCVLGGALASLPA